MKLFETDIAGVWVAESNPHSDHRGSFHRLICADEEQQVVGGAALFKSTTASQIGLEASVDYTVKRLP